MNNPKIAIYLHDYSLLGGVERVTSSLVNLFLENNINCDNVICLQQANSTPKVNYNNAIKIEVLNCQSVFSKEFESKLKSYIESNKIEVFVLQVQDLLEANRIAAIVSKANCKIIPVLHASPYNYIKWFFPNKFTSLKTYFRYLKMTYYWKPKNLFLFKKLIKTCRGMVCVSQAAADELKQIFRKYESSITFVNNPVSFSKEIKNIPKEKNNTLIYVGRLSGEKHPFEMLKLWEVLAPKFPNWNFQLLGDGDCYAGMKKYIETHQLKNISLEGSVSNVEDYLEKSKICILLSYFEGLPTSLLEASRFKNALIGYKSVGGVSDIIQDGKNGFILPLHDFNEVIVSIEKLMSDDELRNQMGINASLHLENFSDKFIIKRWKTLLK